MSTIQGVYQSPKVTKSTITSITCSTISTNGNNFVLLNLSNFPCSFGLTRDSKSPSISTLFQQLSIPQQNNPIAVPSCKWKVENKPLHLSIATCNFFASIGPSVSLCPDALPVLPQDHLPAGHQLHGSEDGGKTLASRGASTGGRQRTHTHIQDRS